METLPYKNSTCVNVKADAAVEEHGKTCFNSCPHPLDRNTDCYLDCYRNTLLGDASMNISKPPPSLLVDPWRAALEKPESEGGCPEVKPGRLA